MFVGGFEACWSFLNPFGGVVGLLCGESSSIIFIFLDPLALKNSHVLLYLVSVSSLMDDFYQFLLKVQGMVLAFVA